MSLLHRLIPSLPDPTIFATMASPISNSAEKENLYCCPACGGLVDNRRRDEVRLHHDHVLHPPLDCYVKLPNGRPLQAAAPRAPLPYE